MGGNKSMGFHELQAMFRDNRLHSMMGLVTEVEVLENGSVARCKVKILPEEREIIARVGYSYAGFGIPEVKDLVCILNVRSDEDDALIVARYSSKEDKIPKPAREGHVVIKPLGPDKKSYIDGKKILLGLGETDPDEPLVLGKVFKQYEKDLLTKIADLEDKLASQANQLNQMATTLSVMNTQLIAYNTALAAHTHNGVAAGSGTSGPSPNFATAVTAQNILRTADVTTHSGYATAFGQTQTDILANKADIEALKADPIESDAILSDLSFTKKSP